MPSTSRSAAPTACSSLSPRLQVLSIRWASTSVSVSVVNLCPSASSALFSTQVVLDDAVVHQRDGARAVGMRVGVDVVGLAVGRPAGVGDAGGAARARSRDEPRFQHTDLARGLRRTLSLPLSWIATPAES